MLTGFFFFFYPLFLVCWCGMLVIFFFLGGGHQARRHRFFSGEERFVGRWLTYHQNTLKIGKVTGLGHFILESGGDVPS